MTEGPHKLLGFEQTSNLNICSVVVMSFFFKFREEFKFFSEMNKIFRRELKVDEVIDTSVTEELEECTPEPCQTKGKTKLENKRML